MRVAPALPSGLMIMRRPLAKSPSNVVSFDSAYRLPADLYSPGPDPSRPIFVNFCILKSASCTRRSRRSETITRPSVSSRTLLMLVNVSCISAAGLPSVTPRGVCAKSDGDANACATNDIGHVRITNANRMRMGCGCESVSRGRAAWLALHSQLRCVGP